MRKLWKEYEEGGRALFFHALKLTKDPDEARDLVQEATAQAARRWDTFKGGPVAPWLHIILRRVYLDQRRRAAVRLNRSLEEQIGSKADGVPLLLGEVLEDTGQGPERDTERRDLAGRVREAMGVLTEAHADVLRVVDMDGASYDAAAVMLGVPAGTVRSRLSRAREALRRTLAPVLL